MKSTMCGLSTAGMRQTSSCLLCITTRWHTPTRRKPFEWLSSASYNYQQEIASQELSDATKVIQNFENPPIPGENLRTGDGAYTDDELSYANDPWAKMGRTRTTAQRKAFAERERRRMADRVKSLADKLHLSNVEIVTDTSTLQDRRAKAKGFYNTRTGKITIVLPNHASVQDAEQTLLHEAVAHHGLRELFGEHFDTFLDNVFENADEGIRAQIRQMAGENGWDTRTATEEYLASLAEDTNFEDVNQSWWRKIKQAFLRMLHAIGFDGFTGVTLTDNELRYILWRSYENMRAPGSRLSILGAADDTVMQHKLGVGNYAQEMSNGEQVADSGEKNLLFRKNTRKTPAPADNSEAGRMRNELDHKLGFLEKLLENYQDRHRPVKQFLDLLRRHGITVSTEDDFYLQATHVPGKNEAEFEEYERRYHRPLIKAIHKLMDKGFSYRDVQNYVMLKHGYEERNPYMLEREQQEFDRKHDEWLGKHPNATPGEIDKRLSRRPKDKDYSGITAIEQETGMSAPQFIANFESKIGTDELNQFWEAVRAATGNALRKSYEGGNISRETYEELRSRYNYYVPFARVRPRNRRGPLGLHANGHVLHPTVPKGQRPPLTCRQPVCLHCANEPVGHFVGKQEHTQPNASPPRAERHERPAHRLPRHGM